MKDKKLIILIILMVAAALSLIYGITVSPKGKRGTSVKTPVVEQHEGVEPARRIVPTKRRAKKTAFTIWGRNPFVPKQAPIAPGAELSLDGIMWHEANPKAMINGIIVGVGDKIGPNKIVSIKKDRVLLNDGIEDFAIRLER